MPNVGGDDIAALISFVCCLVLFGAIGVGVVVWLLRRSSGKKDQEYEYKLDRLSGDMDEVEHYGQGYVIVRLSDNQKLDWQSLSKGSGLFSFRVAGTSHNIESLQDPSFSPGKRLSLVPEPDNPYDPNAIAVYNENETKKAGYVPKERISDVSRLLEEEPVRCICIWETVKEKQRVNIRLLIARHDTRIKLL